MGEMLIRMRKDNLIHDLKKTAGGGVSEGRAKTIICWASHSEA